MMAADKQQRYISWFSCGAASATATKLAISEFGKDAVRIVRQDTGSEHPDNERFMAECQDWFGKEIEVHRSDKYVDIWDVFYRTRYLSGTKGAPCTAELKRKVAEGIIEYGKGQQVEILGYTAEEQGRVEKFIAENTERKLYPILVERGLTKDDCLGFVDRAGIELPAMYKLGYPNNNCIGCVKAANGGYWRKIKQDFPDVFWRMAGLERGLDAAINKHYEKITLEDAKAELGKAGDDLNEPDDKVSHKKESFKVLADGQVEVRRRMFLDVMPDDFGRDLRELNIQCGLICMGEHDDA